MMRRSEAAANGFPRMLSRPSNTAMTLLMAEREASSIDSNSLIGADILARGLLAVVPVTSMLSGRKVMENDICPAEIANVPRSFAADFRILGLVSLSRREAANNSPATFTCSEATTSNVLPFPPSSLSLGLKPTADSADDTSAA